MCGIGDENVTCVLILMTDPVNSQRVLNFLVYEQAFVTLNSKRLVETFGDGRLPMSE